jgi:Replication-relaxation
MNLTPTTPFTLTAKDEDILKAVYQYRYMTSLDVAHLLFKPTYLPYVRGRLARLAGGKTLQPNTYLCSFKLPVTTGNSPLIFTLGMKGQEFLSQAIGQPVDWYFRPNSLKFFSYSAILHHLLLTRFLVACRYWCRDREDFQLLEERTSYELAKAPPKVTLTQNNKKTLLPVIPDAWIKFDRLEHGQHKQYLAVLFELDRGMEHGQKFKHHVRGRIELIRSGEYQRIFGVPGVIVSYLTTGQTPEYRTTRCKAMNRWTQEVLTELNLKSWASIFRFTAVEFDQIYASINDILASPVSFRPDSPTTPVSLLTL